MDIIGAVIFMVLPYLAGYSCKSILRWKGTNQIETYLIGFFLLFLVQAVIFIPCVWVGTSLGYAVNLLTVALAVILILFLGAFFIMRVRKKKDVAADKPKTSWKKTDRLCFGCMVLVFLLILIRMVSTLDILREDIVLETVLTTIKADSLYQVHPLTGRMMEAGMITSKKIITLPLFYAAVVKMTGLDAAVFLYLVMGIMTLLGVYYASALLFSQVSSLTRSKLYMFWITLGLLILSGDYHTGVISYKLLYQGYEGSTICFGVILPYLLYLIAAWYQKETKEEKNTMGCRIMYLFKIGMALVTSILITGLGNGFVFLFMAVVIAGICCLLKSIKEVRECRES